MIIIKKQIPEKITKQLRRPHEDEELNTYYLIDGSIYIHTKFFIDEDEPPLTLLHDLQQIETEMIKHMKAIGKVHMDEDNVPFFSLFDLGLWFYERIPSKDWYDLLGLLRIIKEDNKMDNYIKLSDSEDAPRELVEH